MHPGSMLCNHSNIGMVLGHAKSICLPLDTGSQPLRVLYIFQRTSYCLVALHGGFEAKYTQLQTLQQAM